MPEMDLRQIDVLVHQHVMDVDLTCSGISNRGTCASQRWKPTEWRCQRMPNEVEQRLKAIEERVSKASPPPWFYHPMRGAVYSKGTPILAVVEDVNPAFKTEFADLMFVENARDDVPWLLSLLREREEENRRLRALLERAYIGARHEACGDHDDPDPTWHCCDWRELAEEINDAMRGEQP